MTGEAGWGPALAVLAAGLVLGGLLAARLWAGRRAPSADPAVLARRALEARRDHLLDQLRELDETGAGRDAEAAARQRQQLELETARVLAELDEAPPAPASKEAAAPAVVDAVAARRAARRGFLWGVASAAALAGLAFWAAGIAQPRGDRPMTGDIGVGTGAETGAGDEQSRLQSRLQANPDDIEARLELVQIHLGRRELMQVWEHTQYVLERSPGHPRALSYQALVRLAMGQPQAAEGMLQQAMAAAPELLEPRLHLALVYARTSRLAQADAVLAEAARRFPQQAEGLERLRRDMNAQASTLTAGEEAGAAAPPAAPDERSVSGVIELAPSAGGTTGGVVFVTARAAGETEGPPVAVKRLPASFPLRFSLGSADSMMGAPLPERLRLEARLDADGDPLTRSPQDPSARLDGVRLGQAELRLQLR